MTNKTIQERLSFFALAGTRDAVHENLMFTNRRRKQASPTLLEVVGNKKVLETKQLSLF